MNISDDRIKQLLREAVDHELGDRLDIPAAGDQLRRETTVRRRSHWLVPLAAAAAVVVIAGGAAAIVGISSGHRAPPGAGTAKVVELQCAATSNADRAKSLDPDKDVLMQRAEAVAHGPVTVTVSPGLVDVTVSGAAPADVRYLCTSSLVLRPLVAPVVRPVGKQELNSLSRLTFPVPTTAAAYDRLSAKQQAALTKALQHSVCGTETTKADAAAVACADPSATDYPSRTLVGRQLVTGQDISGAQAQAPAAGGLVEWTVSVTLTDEGLHAFGTYTAAHNTGGRSSATSAADCSAHTTSCGDFIAFIAGGRIVSLPVTESAITGGVVEISGNFTEQTAKSLAASLRSGELPIPLAEISGHTVAGH